MGKLNWSGGLAGAAEGVSFLAEQETKNIDRIYKEMSDANLRRFRSKEAATKRTFDAGEKTKDRAVTTAGQEARQAEATASREATSAFREGQTTQAAARQGELVRHNKAAEETSAKNAETSAESQKERLQLMGDQEDRRVNKQIIDQYNDEIDGYGFMITPEQRAGAELKRDRKIARSELDKDQTSSFDKAFGRLGRSAGGISLATTYARMSPEDRKAVDAQAKELVGSEFRGKALGKMGALAKAIHGYGFGDTEASFLPAPEASTDSAGTSDSTKGEPLSMTNFTKNLDRANALI